MAGTLILPMVAFAQFQPGNYPSSNGGLNIVGLVDIIFNILWPIAVAFFIIMFVLAAFQFAAARGEPETVGKARQSVIWGAVGVVVALLAWSIPFILRTQLGV